MTLLLPTLITLSVLYILITRSSELRTSKVYVKTKRRNK